MKKTLSFTLFLTFILFLSSCSTTPNLLKLQGNYAYQNSIVTSTPIDDVWEKVIDYLAEKCLPINTLSKESGLIVANEVTFHNHQVTCEFLGKIQDPNAYFVTPYVTNMESVERKATCHLNVRIKPIDHTKTFIQINCGSVTGHIKGIPIGKFEVIEIPTICKSTGVFEESLLNLFK